MPDVEKALEALKEAERRATSTNGLLPLIHVAIARLTEEKPPEPEVWHVEHGGRQARVWANDVCRNGERLTDWILTEYAERIAFLPTLEREHAALVSAARKVVEANAAVQGCTAYSFDYAKARTELNTAVNELDALVEGKP